MAKRLTTEDHLALLRQLRASSPSPQSIAQLQSLLQSPHLHGIVVKAAAELAEKWDARALIPALITAAQALAPENLDTDPQKRDPGCEGKEALLRTLIAWDADAPDFYLQAALWHQFAPIMNGKKDVAAECRGLAALGIAQTRGGTAGTDAAIMRLIDLLADKEAPTRVRAAQALGMWRGPEAAPVLRLKAHVGDEQPEVLGEALASLLRQDPAQLPFLTTFLTHEDPAIIEAAALALGESRLPAALAPLIATWTRLQRHPIRTSLLMSIALLRHEDSLSWLLTQLSRAHSSRALDLLSALRLYRNDPKTTAQIQSALPPHPDLPRAFQELFT